MAFFVGREEQALRLADVALEEDFLQIEDDFSDVFDHSIDGGEFVHGAVDFEGGDGGAFQRGQEHPAE